MTTTELNIFKADDTALLVDVTPRSGAALPTITAVQAAIVRDGAAIIGPKALSDTGQADWSAERVEVPITGVESAPIAVGGAELELEVTDINGQKWTSHPRYPVTFIGSAIP